jgi:hypothetical protein
MENQDQTPQNIPTVEPTITPVNPNNPPNKSKALAIIGVILLLLIVAGATVFFTLARNKQSDALPLSNNSNNQQTNTNKLTVLNFKRANEYFPTLVNGNQIRGTGIESYKVAPISDVEYKRTGSKPDDRSAKIDSGFLAFYGQEGGNIQNIVKEKTIRIIYTKFPNSVEAEDARTLTDEIFGSLAQGYNKVSLPLEGITYWGAYREVPSDKARDNLSSDARILFPEAMVMVRIDLSGGYTLEDFRTIVKSYVDSLLNNNTQFVEENEVLRNSK